MRYKNKAIKPKIIYEHEDGKMEAEPFMFIACACPSCKMEVPYTNFCCECGQKFKLPIESEGDE